MRLGASSVIVVGIAGVVGVLVSILAMVAGLTGMMTSNGRPDRAIVISTGSSFEVLSNLSRDATRTDPERTGNQAWCGREARRIGRGAGDRAGSAEGRQSRQPSLRGAGPEVLRGPAGASDRRGRTFEPAVRELIVGRSAQRQFRGLEVGSRITLRGSRLDRRRRVREQRRPARGGTDHRRRDAAIGLPAQCISVGRRAARLGGVVRRFQLHP